MVSTNKLKNGMTLKLDGELYRVESFQHVKPGKGNAFVRTTLKGMRNGKTIDKTFRADEDLEQATITRRELQHLYREGAQYVFMDPDSFEQELISPEALGDAALWLREGDSVELVFHEGEVIDVNLSPSLELKVTETDPGVQGDRVGSATKRATLETGAVVNVPLFIEEGETIKVDTRSASYISRA